MNLPGKFYGFGMQNAPIWLCGMPRSSIRHEFRSGMLHAGIRPLNQLRSKVANAAVGRERIAQAILEYAINSAPTDVHDKKKSQHTSPDYWALHPTTGLCPRLLGFDPDYWALHPTTGLCARLLGFAPDDWALHPMTGLCTR